MEQNLYKSKEIRWFLSEKSNTITKWFSDHNMDFSKTQARTDFYLPVPGKVDISIKLREGNLEIKQRNGEPESNHLTENAIGYIEDWVKWSFEIKDDDELAKSIIKDKKFNWIEVYKERIGVKLSVNSDGTIAILGLKDRIPFGCQVEYTRLLINGKEWFTFGFEWFGEKYLEVNSKLIDDILGDSKLLLKESLGYGEFLNKTLIN